MIRNHDARIPGSRNPDCHGRLRPRVTMTDVAAFKPGRHGDSGSQDPREARLRCATFRRSGSTSAKASADKMVALPRLRHGIWEGAESVPPEGLCPHGPSGLTSHSVPPERLQDEEAHSLPYTSGPSDAPGRRSCNDLVRSLSYSPARVTAIRPERTNSVMR